MTLVTLKKYALTVGFALWIWIAPIRPALATVAALPMVDLVLALVCAFRAKRPITSSGLKKTIAKIFLYEMATLLAFATETYLLGPLIPAIKIVTGLIGVTELKSCLEHLDELSGKSLFSAAIAKLAPPQPVEPPAPQPPPQGDPK